MGRGHSLLFGGVAGAALGVVLAPRRGEPRRVALQRLRLAVRPAHGSLRAFAGTPCATAALDSANAGPEPADL
jgi:hypothetical protein